LWMSGAIYWYAETGLSRNPPKACVKIILENPGARTAPGFLDGNILHQRFIAFW
jgi:hypothetical protein